MRACVEQLPNSSNLLLVRSAPLAPSSPVITFGTFVRPGLLGSDEIGAALSQTVDDGQAKVDSLISEVWWALLLFPALCGVAISLAMLRTVLPRR